MKLGMYDFKEKEWVVVHVKDWDEANYVYLQIKAQGLEE